MQLLLELAQRQTGAADCLFHDLACEQIVDRREFDNKYHVVTPDRDYEYLFAMCANILRI